MPFANSQDAELESIVNDYKPIVDDISLLDALRFRTFLLVVPLAEQIANKAFSALGLGPPFCLPYGTSHEWNEDRYRSQLQEHKLKRQYEPAFA